ncbi:methyltransferase domain-containing protein [Dactylosporangium sp. NPDC051541]|uniref:methyltransferase domain-containing protein n=1 Tax=Dactylosporangium sp. NPDC051541 TaxID=3363977 RepID=UPI0037A1AE8D
MSMLFITAGRLARRYLPEPARTGLQQAAQAARRGLPGSRVQWGNINTRAPFSEFWGWDRGLPVDRYYIERFIAANRGRLKGSALEVQSAQYTGEIDAVEHTTVLDIDESNTRATLIADLNEPESLPAATFDCVVLTQTLQYTDPVAALRNVGRSLKPGGRAVVTVPCLSRVDPEAPSVDLWRWTPAGLRRTIELAGLRGTVAGHGNSLAAAAFMLGLSAEDVGRHRLALDDEAYPVIAGAVIEPA